MCICIYIYTHLFLHQVQVLLSHFCCNRSRFSVRNMITSCTSELNNYKNFLDNFFFFFAFPAVCGKKIQFQLRSWNQCFPFPQLCFQKWVANFLTKVFPSPPARADLNSVASGKSFPRTVSETKHDKTISVTLNLSSFFSLLYCFFKDSLLSFIMSESRQFKNQFVFLVTWNCFVHSCCRSLISKFSCLRCSTSPGNTIRALFQHDSSRLMATWKGMCCVRSPACPWEPSSSQQA